MSQRLPGTGLREPCPFARARPRSGPLSRRDRSRGLTPVQWPEGTRPAAHGSTCGFRSSLYPVCMARKPPFRALAEIDRDALAAFQAGKIGRASCRERVEMSEGAASVEIYRGTMT